MFIDKTKFHFYLEHQWKFNPIERYAYSFLVMLSSFISIGTYISMIIVFMKNCYEYISFETSTFLTSCWWKLLPRMASMLKLKLLCDDDFSHYDEEIPWPFQQMVLRTEEPQKHLLWSLERIQGVNPRHLLQPQRHDSSEQHQAHYQPILLYQFWCWHLQPSHYLWLRLDL